MQFLFAGRPCRFVNRMPQAKFYSSRVCWWHPIPASDRSADPVPPLDDVLHCTRSSIQCSCSRSAHSTPSCADNALLSTCLDLLRSTLHRQPAPSATSKWPSLFVLRSLALPLRLPAGSSLSLAPIPHPQLIHLPDTLICNPLVWELSAWSGEHAPPPRRLDGQSQL